jgi:hypothetical protein
MKKMMLLMMLVFTVPATAGVVITCDGGIIGYDATGIAGNVRAFALDITSDGTITDVQCLSTDYDIYPGSIQIDETTGEVTDPGSCVCDPSYAGTLDGIGTTGVTVEMGSLYASGEPAPADTGDLVQVTHTGATLNVDVNVIRGGIVMENPDLDPDHNLPIACGGCPCRGDIRSADGLSGPDGRVTFADWQYLLQTMMTNSSAAQDWEVTDIAGMQCADIRSADGLSGPDGRVTYADWQYMLQIMMQQSSAAQDWEVSCF